MRWWVAVAWIEELFTVGEQRVDELEVYGFSGTSISADLKQRRVSLCSSSVETGLCIRTIDKGKIGSSSTNDPQQWQACLDAAIAGGRLATPQEWKGLPDPVALPTTDFAWDPDLVVEPTTAQELLVGMLEGALDTRMPRSLPAGRESRSARLRLQTATASGTRPGNRTSRSRSRRSAASPQDTNSITPFRGLR